MHKENIKVGDIIKIVNGMDIPVDGICIEANGVLADESALTGESDHLAKKVYRNVWFEKLSMRQKKASMDLMMFLLPYSFLVLKFKLARDGFSVSLLVN